MSTIDEPRPVEGIVSRLRALSRYEHSDFSIGDEAAEEIEKLHSALREIGSWDCKGDALHTAYDQVFGAGEWERLFSTSGARHQVAMAND